jgi:hypothetical protein
MKTEEQIEAWLDELEGIRPPKPKTVVNQGEVVRDADPHVSRADPNYPNSNGGVVKVRRSDFVTVNMDLYEAQQRQKAEDRRLRRSLDPFRLGHWDDPQND